MKKKGHKFSAGRAVKIGDRIFKTVTAAGEFYGQDYKYISNKIKNNQLIDGEKGEFVDEIAKREFASMDEKLGLPN